MMETTLSMVDGQAGRLIVRGRSLEQLAGATFEEMATHLWEGLLEAEPSGWSQRRSRLQPELVQRAPMAGLRILLETPGLDSQDVAVSLPVALAAARGLRWQGSGGQAAELLTTILGHAPTENQVRALNRYWVTVAEHGMNASTYTARVVASTLATDAQSVCAALCALEGPLHGGAPGPVLDMLDQLAACPDRKSWLAREVREGRRLMGFGHRIYKVRDPRALVLGEACQSLEANQRLELARQVEREAQEVLADLKPGRGLQTNVEFYTAVLLEALGFQRHEFTALFACGRVLGWLAHAAEQRRDGRLIRPESRYVGELAVHAQQS